ncbi:hypothetical protein J6590_090716 [Homalodisca vitripennis]|nr:hypothetical protein J6590_090716 [Homalodisca vitripennis]
MSNVIYTSHYTDTAGESYVKGYSYPQQFYPSITLAVEDELLDNHWTTDTILYNFAPSTYWKEYVKNYCHLRTMQIMREWYVTSKELIYYKYLDCEDPVDLSLPEKNLSTLPSSMAARLRLHPSKKNEENDKENCPPKANENVKSGFKRRTIFNQKQLRELTRVFSTSKYISGKQRLRLAQQLGSAGADVARGFLRTASLRKHRKRVPGSIVSSTQPFCLSFMYWVSSCSTLIINSPEESVQRHCSATERLCNVLREREILRRLLIPVFFPAFIKCPVIPFLVLRDRLQFLVWVSVVFINM